MNEKKWVIITQEKKVIKIKKKSFNLYGLFFKLMTILCGILLIGYSIKKRLLKNFFYFKPILNKSPPKNKIPEANNLKIALCTMGKKENLYAKEYIEYYVNLGVDHIFIYDDNEPNTERISDVLDNKYRNHVTIYENIKDKIKLQSDAFTTCYHNNKAKYDWFIMVDMDEFLYVINDTLKDYLVDKKFDECDFIKFHWVTSTDNNLIHYDPKPLFERFTGPFLKEKFIKSMIRGNISELKYWVHSPYYSPVRNITCNNVGEKLNYKAFSFESINDANFDKAFILHFRYKSTEEFINKFKRGYSYWFGNKIKWFLSGNIETYFERNNITLEKINYVEKELKINLFKIRLKYYLLKIFYLL